MPARCGGAFAARVAAVSAGPDGFSAQTRAYLRGISAPEAPILAEIRAQTAAHRAGNMAVAPEQAALLAWLARLIGAERYLEIGVFAGYSSTAMALALPEHGRLSCCDINITFAQMARQNWQKAGVEHKISLYLQPALITLRELAEAGESGSYDMALIDADKPFIPQYYEACLPLVRSGGIIAIDNVLSHGRVVSSDRPDAPPGHARLHAFNAALPQDGRVHVLALPLGDGLTLLMKQ